MARNRDRDMVRGHVSSTTQRKLTGDKPLTHGYAGMPTTPKGTLEDGRRIAITNEIISASLIESCEIIHDVMGSGRGQWAEDRFIHMPPKNTNDALTSDEAHEMDAHNAASVNANLANFFRYIGAAVATLLERSEAMTDVLDVVRENNELLASIQSGVKEIRVAQMKATAQHYPTSMLQEAALPVDELKTCEGCTYCDSESRPVINLYNCQIGTFVAGDSNGQIGGDIVNDPDASNSRSWREPDLDDEDDEEDDEEDLCDDCACGGYGCVMNHCAAGALGIKCPKCAEPPESIKAGACEQTCSCGNCCDCSTCEGQDGDDEEEGDGEDPKDTMTQLEELIADLHTRNMSSAILMLVSKICFDLDGGEIKEATDEEGDEE